MIRLKKRRQAGYSLVEVIVYVAILGMLSALIISLLLVMLRSFVDFRLVRKLNQSTMVTLDRFSRVVHDALSVDAVESTLGTNPGRLVLNTTLPDGSPATVEFSLQGTTLVIVSAGVAASSTASQVAVTNLIFRQLNTPHSQAVRMEATLEASRAGLRRSGTFTTTAILRGSY